MSAQEAVTSTLMQHPLAFPSPAQGVWHLGPFPLRAYALMIILGIVVAVWLGERRWAARGGTPGVVIDIAVWAVPFGLVGGRLYHVITDNQMYFGEGRDPADAFKVWNGGLGIWGAVAMGALGAYIGCRRSGINLRPFADAIAPGIALAQGIGRWGNWFNQELYGRPTTLPWAVTIDQEHRPRLPDGSLDPRYADLSTFHPTFLYESLWCIGVAVLVIWAGRRFNLNYGRSFALYVAAYAVGRGWIEWLRIDNAHHFFGLRLNDYTALLVFLGAVAYLYVYRGKGDVQEVLEKRPRTGPDDGEPLDEVGKPSSEASARADHGEPAEGEAGREQAAGHERAEQVERETGHEQATAQERTVAAEPRGETEPAVEEPPGAVATVTSESAESAEVVTDHDGSSASITDGRPTEADEATEAADAETDGQVPAAKRWWEAEAPATEREKGKEGR